METVVRILTQIVAGTAFGAGKVVGSKALEDKAKELKNFLQTKHPSIFGEIEKANEDQELVEKTAKNLEEAAKKDNQLQNLIIELEKSVRENLTNQAPVENRAKNIGITGGNFFNSVTQNFQ